MAHYYTEANLKHIMALIAPKSRSLYVLVEFEVFGNIHGVNYTKYAKETAKKLGVNGWIRYNNKRGTIVGEVEGEKDKIDQMAMWLKLQGKVWLTKKEEHLEVELSTVTLGVGKSLTLAASETSGYDSKPTACCTLSCVAHSGMQGIVAVGGEEGAKW